MPQSVADRSYCAPRFLGDNLDLFAERFSNVEPSHRYVADDGERVSQHQPQRTKKHAHANDSEQADRRWQPDGVARHHRYDDIALKLLDDHDEG